MAFIKKLVFWQAWGTECLNQNTVQQNESRPASSKPPDWHGSLILLNLAFMLLTLPKDFSESDADYFYFFYSHQRKTLMMTHVCRLTIVKAELTIQVFSSSILKTVISWSKLLNWRSSVYLSLVWILVIATQLLGTCLNVNTNWSVS